MGEQAEAPKTVEPKGDDVLWAIIGKTHELMRFTAGQYKEAMTKHQSTIDGAKAELAKRQQAKG